MLILESIRMTREMYDVGTFPDRKDIAMIIQCTKALLDKLGIQNSDLLSPEGYEQFPESLMGWHANLIKMNRKNVMILMNNESRYPIVIYGLVKKDIENIASVIQEAVRVALQMEGVKDSIIESYLASSGAIQFSKTANRSMIAKMNNAVREIEMMADYIEHEATIQRFISLQASRFIQMDGPKRGYYPKDRMIERLAKLHGFDESKAAEKVLDVELYQLNIQLDLLGHDIWRRVLVPSTFSFRHLHNIIQTVFDWQNYHLHDFTVHRENDKPLNIVMDDDPETLEYLDFENNVILQERFVSLQDAFSPQSEVFYDYDFGDSWRHQITLEKTVQGHALEAKFIEGDGQRPPEDVGGEHGFNEYLRIVRDAADPDHENMLMWSSSQIERIFTIAKVNQRLKNVIFDYFYI